MCVGAVIFVGAVICDGGVTFAGGGIFVGGVIFVGDVHHYAILFFSFSPVLRRRCSILRAFPMWTETIRKNYAVNNAPGCIFCSISPSA